MNKFSFTCDATITLGLDLKNRISAWLVEFCGPLTLSGSSGRLDDQFWTISYYGVGWQMDLNYIMSIGLTVEITVSIADASVATMFALVKDDF